MNDLQVRNVPFMGTELMAAQDESGQVWAGVRWLCNGLGLSKGQRDRQVQNIQTDRVLSKGASNLRLPTNGGKQEVLCLKLDHVPLWLAKINITTTMEQDNPDLADRMEQFQLRAKDVLAEAFIKPKATTPMSPAQLIAAQAQILVDMEERMNKVEGHALALEAKVDTAIKAFARPAEDHWKGDMDKAIKELCADIHWSLPKLQGKLYAELEQAANCNVNARLSRLRTRKKKNGARHRDAMAMTKLDAISADKQLRAIFESIVRTWQARAVPSREGEIV